MQQKGLQDRKAEGKRFGMTGRRHRRWAVREMTARIADGHRHYDSRVFDVSTGGFRLRKKADDFAASGMSYTVILSFGRQKYRVLAKPCWVRTDADTSHQEIGFRIIDAPWQWLEMVMLHIDGGHQTSGEFNA